mmetsp:Transcript_28581/g.55979  ORF Transcript_28581/g.55979 Transcript_28581/m.55979 type:complete len:108 (+) Transcript_28581:256-579(+)
MPTAIIPTDKHRPWRILCVPRFVPAEPSQSSAHPSCFCSKVHGNAGRKPPGGTQRNKQWAVSLPEPKRGSRQTKRPSKSPIIFYFWSFHSPNWTYEGSSPLSPVSKG